MAVSFNSDMFGAIWMPYSQKQSLTLPNKQGAHTVYAKFTNPTGAVSEIASSTIIYESVVTSVPVPTIQSAPAIAPPIPVPTAPPQAPTTPEELGAEPFFDPVDALVKLIAQEKKKKEEGYGCPERPNAFSVGAPVVRDRATGKKYVMFKSRGVVCPVLSNAILHSWGIRNVSLTATIAGMRISSPLPYRPGTVVRARENGQTYFVNSQGRLHMVGSTKILSALGYRTALTRVDSRTVVTAFPAAVTLSRTDIHPDGTLFILNERAGLFAVLHNRILHPINKKTLQIYGENPARAVRFRVGEKYETGDSWSK